MYNAGEMKTFNDLMSRTILSPGALTKLSKLSTLGKKDKTQALGNLLEGVMLRA
jgi:hypothetical protein